MHSESRQDREVQAPAGWICLQFQRGAGQITQSGAHSFAIFTRGRCGPHADAVALDQRGRELSFEDLDLPADRAVREGEFFGRCGGAPQPINGLKREEMIASGSMILHEVYFDSLGGTGGDPDGALKAAIERDFGSVDAWRTEFTAMGKAQGGGSGWTLLVWSPRRRRLVNAWAADHAHNLAGATPLIALDMYEHSYHMDFGAKAAAYVDAFMQNLSWTAAEAALANVEG